MKINKQCSICRVKLAKFTCRMCGSLICEDCYNKNAGVCVNCKIGRSINI